MEKVQFARDLREKDEVSAPFLVKFAAVQVGKTGKPYMNLVLMDRTGEVEARIWDDVSDHAGQAVRDSFVMINGKVQSYQGRRQVVVKQLRVLREDEVNPKDYMRESDVDAGALYERLLGYVASMKDPFYRALAEATLRDDADIVDRIQRAPAAKSLHHAYKGGLLEHVVSITGILDFLAGHYAPHVDRDLLFLGGFFHDIGKIWELSYDRVTDYTTEGRLIGHLVMGVELVERKIRELEAQPGRLPGAFPEEKRLLVKHVILAHHGRLEYGSPKRPKCLEAFIVHGIDDLDSKVNGVRAFVEQDQTPGRWTGLNRQYERFFLKPSSLD
ncbi:MAG TPA: HD domain-containing protein [Bdellovibrionota bacterium]|jgi:3'-5' exoribonuclease|nr:HD domain-containing protein [Bdellovibrionota bacterium]